jgi:hypothetical protein
MRRMASAEVSNAPGVWKKASFGKRLSDRTLESRSTEFNISTAETRVLSATGADRRECHDP